MDLSRTADADYVARCGVNLDALLVGQPPPGRKAVELLGDLVRRPRIRVLVVDSLSEIAGSQEALRALHSMLPRLQQMVQERKCALVILDEPQAPWLRWLQLDTSSQVRSAAALHIELQHEQWLYESEKLIGYSAQARLLKSRWAHGIHSTPLAIIFNGTVKSRETW